MIWMLLSALLGALLLISGVPKLREPDRTLAAVRGYRLLHASLERSAAYALPIAEILLGVLLLGSFAVPLAPAAAAILFFIFFVALTINLLRGRRQFDCGCFSFVESQAPRIGWFHAVRALVLAGFSALLALVPAEYGPQITPLPEQLLAFALAALVVAAGLSAVGMKRIYQPGHRSVDTHLAGAAAELHLHP